MSHQTAAYDVATRVFGPDPAVLLVVGEPGAGPDLSGCLVRHRAKVSPSSDGTMYGGSLTEANGTG